MKNRLALLLGATILIYPILAGAQDRILPAEFDSARAELLAARQADDRAAIANAQLTMGGVLGDHGLHAQAIERLERAEMAFERLGDHQGMARTFRRRAEIEQARGDHVEAIRLLHRALESLQRGGLSTATAELYYLTAQNYLAMGNFRRAIADAQQARDHYQTLNEELGVARQWTLLGRIHAANGDFTNALPAFQQAVSILESYRNLADHDEWLRHMVDYWLAVGNQQRALELVAEALPTTTEPGTRVDLFLRAARAELALGRPEAAQRAAQQALQLAEQTQQISLAITSRELLTTLAQQQGNLSEALTQSAATRTLSQTQAEHTIAQQQALVTALLNLTRSEAELQANTQIAGLRQDLANSRRQSLILWPLIVLLGAGVIGLLWLWLGSKRLLTSHIQASRKRLAELDTALESQSKDLAFLHGLVDVINQEQDSQEMLAEVLHRSLNHFPAAAKGALFVVNHDSKLCRPMVEQGYRYQQVDDIVLTVEQAEARYVKNGQRLAPGIYLHQSMPPLEDHPNLTKKDPVSSLVALLLQNGEQLEGVLILESSQADRVFHAEEATDLARLRSLGIQALLRLRALEQLKAIQARLAEAEEQSKSAPSLTQSRQDELTGLPTTTVMAERLNRESLKALRNNASYVLVMVGIDNMTAISERYGADSATEVLAAVGGRISSMLRGQDAVCRLDETSYLVLLADTDLAGGYLVVEKLRNGVAGDPVQVQAGKHAIPLRLSMNVAVMTHKR